MIYMSGDGLFMGKQWERIFRKRKNLSSEPHEDMPWVVREFKKMRVKRVLDLGCGTGRHTMYLAMKGFEVYGFDISKTGVRQARDRLGRGGLEADVRVADMVEPFPYRTGFFDAIVSINVIHHNKLADIRRTIKQMARVLRPKGLAFIAIPSHLPISIKKFNIKTPTLYRHIEINTFLPLDGDEKGLAHHIFNEEEIRKEFKMFRILSTRKDSLDHWCVLMQKR